MRAAARVETQEVAGGIEVAIDTPDPIITDTREGLTFLILIQIPHRPRSLHRRLQNQKVKRTNSRAMIQPFQRINALFS